MIESDNRQNSEEPIDEGLGVFVRNKTLYHGSATPEISVLRSAEETTLGNGVYLLPLESEAAGYARRRARGRNTKPVIYGAAIENLKLLDLRKDENVNKIMPGFAELLSERLMRPGLPWNDEEVLNQSIDLIRRGLIGSGNIRKVVFANGELFKKYIQGLGYDGLIGLEGGEGDDIGNHETYLIFDPSKAKIIEERQI
jgi:hypothetical protein